MNPFAIIALNTPKFESLNVELVSSSLLLIVWQTIIPLPGRLRYSRSMLLKVVFQMIV